MLRQKGFKKNENVYLGYHFNGEHTDNGAIVIDYTDYADR